MHLINSYEDWSVTYAHNNSNIKHIKHKNILHKYLISNQIFPISKFSFISFFEYNLILNLEVNNSGESNNISTSGNNSSKIQDVINIAGSNVSGSISLCFHHCTAIK